MALILRPPAPLDWPAALPSIFLAGSIAQGAATPWQPAFEAALADAPVALLNPRRLAWDASWEQSAANPLFRQQVEWELEAQERATLIVMYFDPATQAPITLLELGLFAASGRMIVCCPPGFWRRGNVEIVCEHYGVPQVPDLAALIAAARTRLAPHLPI